MGILLTLSEQYEEVRRLRHEGHTMNEAIDKVKSYPQVQILEDSNIKIFDTIISDDEDIDNGQVFDKATGKAIRDLI